MAFTIVTSTRARMSRRSCKRVRPVRTLHRSIGCIALSSLLMSLIGCGGAEHQDAQVASVAPENDRDTGSSDHSDSLGNRQGNSHDDFSNDPQRR